METNRTPPPPPPGMDGLPPPNSHARSVIPTCMRVTSALSLLCSCCIAYAIIRNPKKRSSPKERIILGLSCTDICSSFFFFLGTWLSQPALATCESVGFLIQIGIMIPMYNGFLALYCYCYVCKNWTSQQMKKVEIVGHVLVVTIGLSTAIAGLALELYNAAGIVCWIAPSPRDCTQSYQIIEDGATTDCIRGDNAHIYRIAIYYGIVWVNIVLTFVSFLLIYLRIRKQERTMEAYINDFATTNTGAWANNHNSNNSDSRKVAFRGALYTGAFLITWVPGTVAESFRASTNQAPLAEVPFVVVVIFMSLVPSQGFFNFLIYIQPSVSRCWKEKKRKMIEKLSHMKDENAKGGDDDQQKGCSSDEERKETKDSHSWTLPTSSSIKGEPISFTATEEQRTPSPVLGEITLSSNTGAATVQSIKQPTTNSTSSKNEATSLTDPKESPSAVIAEPSMGAGESSKTVSTMTIQPAASTGTKGETSEDLHLA